jgi:hypothetical protein
VASSSSCAIVFIKEEMTVIYLTQRSGFRFRYRDFSCFFFSSWGHLMIYFKLQWMVLEDQWDFFLHLNHVWLYVIRHWCRPLYH